MAAVAASVVPYNATAAKMARRLEPALAPPQGAGAACC